MRRVLVSADTIVRKECRWGSDPIYVRSNPLVCGLILSQQEVKYVESELLGKGDQDG